jgi:hypothetical protein
MPTFHVYYSPEGRRIAVVSESSKSNAIRAVVRKDRRYRDRRGELYAVEVLVRKHVRIYAIEWLDDDSCRVTSIANGAHVDTWSHGAWLDTGRLPADVAAVAMECRPTMKGGV